jgi:hypothetical protein
VRDEILAAIAGARSRLNRAIVAHRALAWAAPSAAAAAIAAAVLRLAGLEAAGLVLWACVAAAGTAIGAARGLSSRMGSADAARWLDERLGGDELLSAALVCIARGRSGRFDDEVIAAAAALAPLAAAIKVPARPAARKAALAAAAVAASVLALVLARPLDASLAASGEAGRGRAAVSRGSSGRASASELETRAAASALAASLFPDDKRMATLARRALREGRLDDFRDILRGADLDLSSRIDRAVSELEKKKLTRDRDLLRDAMSSLAQAAEAPESRPEQDEGALGARAEGGGTDGPSGPEGGPGDGAGTGSGDRSGRGAAEEGEGGGRGGAPGDGNSGGEGGGSGGAGWGEGSGSQVRRAPVEASSGGGSVTLDLADDSSFFELVLPGESAAAPLASALPESRRSAESAMAREGMPLEYRDFVRSYFMALSKGASE